MHRAFKIANDPKKLPGKQKKKKRFLHELSDFMSRSNINQSTCWLPVAEAHPCCLYHHGGKNCPWHCWGHGEQPALLSMETGPSWRNTFSSLWQKKKILLSTGNTYINQNHFSMTILKITLENIFQKRDVEKGNIF